MALAESSVADMEEIVFASCFGVMCMLSRECLEVSWFVNISLTCWKRTLLISRLKLILLFVFPVYMEYRAGE